MFKVVAVRTFLIQNSGRFNMATENLRNLASPLILKELVAKAENVEDDWVRKEGVGLEYIDNSVPEKLARNLQDDALEEFMEEYPDSTEETVADDVREYLNSNYDHDFMMTRLEREHDEAAYFEKQKEELILILSNMGEYAGVPRSYWNSCASRMGVHLGEMQKYLSVDGAKQFVETYASDWKEAAN